MTEKEARSELERLRAWKKEAGMLFDGLQDLGRTLGIPLGVLVTGPLAIEAAETLRTERDAARADGEAQLRERVKALVDAWSDPDWSGHDAAAPFVRALRNALNYPAPTRVIPPEAPR